MLILSKYKDYYDYLSGIYGVDKKIVLDRTKFDHKEWFRLDENQVWSVLICGKRIDFVHHKGEFIYLEEIIKRYSDKQSRWQDNNDKVYVDREWVNTKIIDDESKTNLEYNCPIMLVRFLGRYKPHSHYIYKYPSLKDLEFNKIMKPQEVYLLLTDWLSPKDAEQQELSNKEKIISNGFDVIHSFRNTK